MSRTQVDLGDGRTAYSVMNVSKLRLTAMLVALTQYDVNGRFLGRDIQWLDFVLRHMMPGPLNLLDSRGFKVTRHSRAEHVEFAVRAVIYQDGTTAGEPAEFGDFVACPRNSDLP